MNRWYLYFALLLLAGSGWIWASRVPLAASIASRAPEPAVDHPAPDFSLTTLDGETLQLSQLRGKPVVLNFWATWCGPCRRELPALQAAAERYAPRVEIVAVDQGEASQTVERYVQELGLTFTIPMDTDLAVGARYRIAGLPTTFFIDRDGVIRRIWAGEMNGIILAEGIALISP